MKRAALIGIISLSGLVSLWALFIWLGETESNYQTPPPITRLEKNATQPPLNTTYQPRSFTSGEVGIYKVRVEKGFLKLPAGKVTFTADLIDFNGSEQWQFSLKGGAIGGLVKYDVTSKVNPPFTHSLEYHTIQTDLASRKVDLIFDEKTHQCRRSLNGKPDGEVKTKGSTYDPLSIIFKFREMNLDQPGEFSGAVCDGKATFPATVTVVGPEELKIGEKTFQTILVEPDLGNLRGVFRKDPDAKLQIWLSNDDYQTPLRIKTKVKHGTFIADLEDYQRE